MELDDMDRRILGELQRNARLTNAELAERVGLSPTPCWRRVKRLEEEGVILRYVAVLDAAKIGVPDSVFLQVTLEKHQPGVLDGFVERIKALDEVPVAYLMAGDYDYLLRVAVSGSAAYEHFLKDKLLAIPGISHLKSAYALSQVKYSTTLPLKPVKN